MELKTKEDLVKIIEEQNQKIASLEERFTTAPEEEEEENNEEQGEEMSEEELDELDSFLND